MKIACLCPTYGRPKLLANALAQFLAQDYPQDKCRLFVLEDAGQFMPMRRTPFGEYKGIRLLRDSDACPNWQERISAGPSQESRDFELWSFFHKFPTLTAKYAFLVDRALEWGAEAFCVWDDDDIYLPRHLADHAAVLDRHGWSHPQTVLSLYTGSLVEESAAGRFHGVLAFRRDFGARANFWGAVSNQRCDYDQAMMGRLRAIAPPGHSIRPPTYVMRWGSTGCDHCSGRSRGSDDSTWYTETPISQPGRWDRFEPIMDAETVEVYRCLVP